MLELRGASAAIHASHGVAACSKQYVLTRPRLFGSPWVHLVRLFPCASSGLARQPSPDCTDTFWFSLPSSGLSFRVPSTQSLRCAFARRDYLLGLLPSSRHHCVAPIREASTAPLARTPVISTVRTLLQRNLRACFIPQPSPGPFLVQGVVHFV